MRKLAWFLLGRCYSYHAFPFTRCVCPYNHLGSHIGQLPDGRYDYWINVRRP